MDHKAVSFFSIRLAVGVLVTVPGDWHLRLEWPPSWKPLVVYDIDYREGVRLIKDLCNNRGCFGK